MAVIGLVEYGVGAAMGGLLGKAVGYAGGKIAGKRIGRVSVESYITA